MRAALFATVAVLVVTLLVSHCAGRPWQQQQQQRLQRQRRPRPTATAVAQPSYAVYEPSTAVAPPPPPSSSRYVGYDDRPSVVAVDESSSSDQSLLPRDQESPREQESPAEPTDYGDDPERRPYAVEPERTYAEPERVYAEPEQNYEVDEAVSVLSDGRVHGVQEQQRRQYESLAPTTTTTMTTTTTTTAATTTTTTTTTAMTTTAKSLITTTDDADASSAAAETSSAAAAETRKSGYVVDGKHYRKYRVEEETPDGFIVGEYGVVSHHDGTTRGVRYTADSSINPRVIYEALAKFLALKRRRRR